MSSRRMRAPNSLWPKRCTNEEVGELRAQLKEERRERENMSREHAKDNERKENAIRKLGEKFGCAQQQLDQARKDKEMVEKENTHLRKLLDIRGKELQNQNLQPRSILCESTDAGLSTLPTEIGDDWDDKNEELPLSGLHEMTSTGEASIPDDPVTKVMINLERQLSLREEKVDTLAAEKKKLKSDHQEKTALKRMFKESEEKRAILKIQLAKIERDHDETITALEQCFEEMKVMSGSNRAKESYRRAIFWEANRCLARQRNAYLRNCKKMATELHMLQNRVKELEFSKSSPSDINDEVNHSECISFDTIVVENLKQAALSKVEKFRHEYEKESMDMEDKLKKEIIDLNKIIIEQEYTISCLRKDVNCQMENDNVAECLEDGEDFVTNSFRQLDQHFLSDTLDPSKVNIPSHRMESSIEKNSRDEAMLPNEINVLAADEPVDSSDNPLEIKEDRVDIGIETISSMPGQQCAIRLATDKDRESIQSLEETVEKQEATINLLNINCHMLEKAIIAKDKEIKEIIMRMEQLQNAYKVDEFFMEEDETSAIDDLSVTDGKRKFVPVNEQVLRAELNCLRLNTTIESEIMKDMIRVLNTQLYNAVKSSEERQIKPGQTSETKGERTINEEMDLQEQLESLHKRSQTALQLSQAEVSALKQQLGKLGSLGNEDPYDITFEWIKY